MINIRPLLKRIYLRVVRVKVQKTKRINMVKPKALAFKRSLHFNTYYTLIVPSTHYTSTRDSCQE